MFQEFFRKYISNQFKKPSGLIGRFLDKANNHRCQMDDLLSFVDIDTPMLGDDGKPRAELLLADASGGGGIL